MLNRIPITSTGAAKLKAELEYLKKTARPAVVAAIAEAREKGDLSENAEYDAAREEQGHIEGRIAELEGKIPALQVIDPKTLNAGDRIVSAQRSRSTTKTTTLPSPTRSWAMMKLTSSAT